METNQKGYLLLILMTIIYAYYIIWLIILPILDNNHYINDYFINKKYAFIFPAVIVQGAICFSLAFIGFQLIQNDKKLIKEKI